MSTAAAPSIDMALCRYSRSEVLASQILQQCPIGLTSAQHGACPCKQRKYNVGPRQDLRVIQCLFPKDYRGNVISDPERFRADVAARASMNANGGGKSMSTAVAEAPKGAKSEKLEKSNAQAANPGLWCGIEIPIIGVCGEKWTGKTLFASSIDPEHTAMADLEDSSATYSSIPFAKRWSLYSEMMAKHSRVPTPLECFEWFRWLVMDEIKPRQFRVLATDPITDIEQGMVDWVYANPQHFGHTKAQYEKAAGIMWGDVKSYWKMLLGIVSTKVETFVFTAHMGAVWKGNSPVEGKRKAKGKETLFELASLYLQLERPLDAEGKQPDKPSARVLKSRLALSSFVDGEIVHKPILPPYLKVATPKAIRDYIRNPPDYAKLKKSEVAPPEQMTDEDKLLIEAGIAENNRVAAEANLTRMERMQKAAEEQARMKREREAQQDANAAKADVADAGETITTATGTVLPKSHEALSGIQEAGDRDDLKALHAKVKDLCAALQMPPDKIADMLAKRGVKAVEELTLPQAEEVRGRLQLVINDRMAKAKAGGTEKPPFDTAASGRR